MREPPRTDGRVFDLNVVMSDPAAARSKKFAGDSQESGSKDIAKTCFLVMGSFASTSRWQKVNLEFQAN